jgi:hypothetical protein
MSRSSSLGSPSFAARSRSRPRNRSATPTSTRSRPSSTRAFSDAAWTRRDAHVSGCSRRFESSPGSSSRLRTMAGAFTSGTQKRCSGSHAPRRSPRTTTRRSIFPSSSRSSTISAPPSTGRASRTARSPWSSRSRSRISGRPMLRKRGLNDSKPCSDRRTATPLSSVPERYGPTAALSTCPGDARTPSGCTRRVSPCTASSATDGGSPASRIAWR